MVNDSCLVCKKFVNRQVTKVQCAKCKKMVHTDCLSPAISPDAYWMCKTCKNDSTESTLGTPEFEALMNKLSGIQNDIDQVKNIQKDMAKTLELYASKIDDFAHKVKNIPIIESTGVENKIQIEKLKLQVEAMDQQIRLNNIIINGLPVTNENANNIVTNIFKSLNLPSTNMIETCYKIGRNQATGGHQTIMVKLLSNEKRHMVFKAFKTKKILKANEIGFTNNESRWGKIKSNFEKEVKSYMSFG
ncbi:unnamed protein product [Psylliodes chrysocephalus]|uniref:PHD-type domain-containing protein n=1 Tax=Psylliodes chrysocephalus TaxID=3402493 RepID=A0A9P0GBZ6_9CUCU|nr:unnamed protein product [Psylliodes chrysocephala]